MRPTAALGAMAAGMGADAITVNGYLGPSTIEPYLEEDLGVFVLVRTSNPDSDRVQAGAIGSKRVSAPVSCRSCLCLGSRPASRRA